MTTKTKIAVGLCSFLTVAPLLGSFIDNENFGDYIGNFTPYIHLTIPQVGGLPFGDAIGALFGLIIFLIGLIGLIIFAVTKFKKTGGLQLLLYLTIIYCGLRALGGMAVHIFRLSHYETETKIFVIAALLSEIVWITFCLWATRQLEVLRK